MPGESRNDAAQRRRERAERLARSGALTRREGSAGATARALAGLPSGWTVLNDLVWPGRRGATIDHVVVGPGGIFVIASQTWTGTVTVEDGVLREDGRPRERAVASAAEAALQVGQMSSRLSITQAMICFATAEEVRGRSREVLLCSTAEIVDVLTKRPAVLNAGQVRQVAQEVDQHFRAVAATLGPVVPRQRQAADDSSSLPAVPRPQRPAQPRIRITGAPMRTSSARPSQRRDSESRNRALRIALLALMLGAVVAAILFASDAGDLLARAML